MFQLKKLDESVTDYTSLKEAIDDVKKEDDIDHIQWDDEEECLVFYSEDMVEMAWLKEK